MTNLDRRTLLAAPGLLALASAAATCAQPKEGQRPTSSSKSLVAYFTRSGNTRVIAGTLQRMLGATIFEIKPEHSYPEDYEQTVEQASQERARGYEPPLAARLAAIRDFETVLLGFPIWGQTAPPIVRSFLRAHDLSGRTLRPFITHGGYGLGDSLAVLATYAPNAKIAAAFTMEADQERRTLNKVKGWIEETGLRG